MTNARDDAEVKQDGWYKYGIMFIIFEAGIAVTQTIFALYTVLTGPGG